MIQQSNYPQNQDPYEIERLIQPFIKPDKKKKFKYFTTKEGRSYRVCSCCGEIVFCHSCNEEVHGGHTHEPSNSQRDTLMGIIEQALGGQYRVIDKFLTNWYKKCQKQPAKSFLTLLTHLSSIFTKFCQDAHYLLTTKLDHPQILTSNSSYLILTVTKYAQYLKSCFPLLKDFVQNFQLDLLSQDERDRVLEMRLECHFVEFLMREIGELRERVREKREKRRMKKGKNKVVGQQIAVQKQKQKQITTQNKPQQPQPVPHIKKSPQPNPHPPTPTIQFLSQLKINKQQRIACYISQDWTRKLHYLHEGESQGEGRVIAGYQMKEFS